MRKYTGLFDDNGEPIKDGDSIVWKYRSMAMNTNFGTIKCYPGNMIIQVEETQVIKYEVRGDCAGYFLNRPSGIGICKETVTGIIKK